MAPVRDIRLCEPRSGLDVRLSLLWDKAPASCTFLWQVLTRPMDLAALHAIYTGPEISFPLDAARALAAAPPTGVALENATVFPAAGDLLLTCLPARVWNGSPDPVFDLGLFYAPGGRTLLPVGLVPGSLCARVPEQELAAVLAACQGIRRLGEVRVSLARVPSSD